MLKLPITFIWGGETDEEKVELLIEAVENLKRAVNIPASIKEVYSGTEEEFLGAIATLAEEAFDDQCTGSNPRYPLIKDMKDLYITAYHGR